MNVAPTLLRALPPSLRARTVTAVLGPTNTGKTHYALERMAAHRSGLIGLPLRLLAREVYGRMVERVGAENVALITGEEKIKPQRARYWVSTIEAMPRELEVDFVAVDEIQLAADPERGHVFTDRILNQRGRSETLLIGASTMRPLLEQLIPGIVVQTRPRLSKLSFAGEKKISRLPPRSAIVAFSADEVYAVAELIRRQKGGAAVVLGALSPRTRNAQVALFQAGEVDYLVATDAIGMGLNLDVDHVAFGSDRKFDGARFRRLHPAEFGQIAGRAGRHLSDGTFGSSGRCPPFEPELIEAIEEHRFDPVRHLQWRNPDLMFGSIAALKASLATQPSEAGLVKAPAAEDVTALEIVSADAEIRDATHGRALVERLWDVCQLPDYRKASAHGHAELVATVYRHLLRGRLPADWFARQVEALDRVEGDIDTLSNRIAQVRTWTFVANRADWLADPEHWQGVTRQVEDRLSDALHERLASRFVDRRTSVLMRRLRENAMLEASVTAGGDVLVEGQHVGTLAGFHFVPDARAAGPEARALNAAAQKALAGELEARAARVALAGDDAFVLANDGLLRWTGEPVARLAPGDKLLEPRLRLLADETLPAAAREQVEQRLNTWLKAHVTRHLGALLVLQDPPDLTGIARGIGFQLSEALGVLDRSRVSEDVKGLDQESRAALRKHGVRFGAYHLYLPLLLKPAPRALAAQLWALRHGGLDQKGRDEIAHLALSGRTSIPADPEVARDLYRAAGFRVTGERALRVDILERLADLIRPAVAYRPGVTPGEPPPGAADGDGFVVTGAMTSLVGCAGDAFTSVLRSLGYQVTSRPGPAITVPLFVPPPPPVASAAPEEPAAPPSDADAVIAAETAEAPAAETVEPAAVDAAEAPAVDATELLPASEAEAPAPEAPAAEAPAIEVTTTEAPAEAAPDGTTEPVPEAAPAESSAAEGATAEAAATESAADGAAATGGETAAAAVPESDAAPAEAAAEPAAEPALIEVWRPGRRDGHRRNERGAERGRGRGRGDQQRQGGRQPEDRAAQGAEQPGGDGRGHRPRHDGHRQGGQRRDGQRWDDRPRQEGSRQDGPRQEGPRHAGPRPDQRHQEPGGDRPRGPRPQQRHQQRDDRREGRPEAGDGRQEQRGEARGQRGPEFRQQRAPERAPDPNSPFAKLAALKAQLESQRKS